jgi:hypothetical protein
MQAGETGKGGGGELLTDGTLRGDAVEGGLLSQPVPYSKSPSLMPWSHAHADLLLQHAYQ